MVTVGASVGNLAWSRGNLCFGEIGRGLQMKSHGVWWIIHLLAATFRRGLGSEGIGYTRPEES